jgi:flagellar hook-basal body complex protein FliE
MDLKGVGLFPSRESFERKPIKENAENFGSYLKDALKKVNASQLEANDLVHGFTIGQDVDLHEVVLAMEKADLTLQLTIQIKNKIIEAYQELMRMQV